MKKKISTFSLISTVFYLFFHVATVVAEDAPSIAGHQKAIGFGIWRIYNEGSKLYIIDERDKRFLDVDSTGNNPIFHINRGGFSLHSTGTIGELSVTFSSSHPDVQNTVKALDTELSGHLKDGRYSYGAKRFDVIGDTLAIFLEGQAGLLGDTAPMTILKKYSNGLEHVGTRLSNTIDPSVVIDVNDVLGPAAILGDCLATYNPETGRVEIPCLSIKGNNTVYSVGQKQRPDSMDFNVNENDVVRVQ